uniref:Uncharacterized protein n=1 Tax=Rhizophora mucronata TaxID=61149 RepID=A0A2P2MWR3_RHIMU
MKDLGIQGILESLKEIEIYSPSIDC